MSLYTFRAGGKAQQLIYQLKYANQPQLGRFLGQLYGGVLANVSWPYPFEGIVPIPLHKRRLRQRGYNQSQFFADGLASVLHIPCMDNCIERIKNTRSQTTYSMVARLKNVSDAFSVVRPGLVSGKHLLLVDDVATTGATLEAAALALLAAGARAISVATLAVVE
jgi:ComF family protein